jgi:hypothetical protein
MNRKGVVASMTVYLLTYNGASEFRDFAVQVFQSPDKLPIPEERNKGKDHHLIVEKVEDLKPYSMSELVTIYERLSGVNVNRFRDVGFACNRVFDALGGKMGPVRKPKKTLSTEETQSVISKANKTKENVPMSKKMIKTVAKIKKSKAPAKKKAKKTVVSKPKNGKRMDPSLSITKLVKDNPRRKGTAGFKSFALLNNGMKVGTYLEKGGRAGDLRWDIAHGFVKVG